MTGQRLCKLLSLQLMQSVPNRMQAGDGGGVHGVRGGVAAVFKKCNEPLTDPFNSSGRLGTAAGCTACAAVVRRGSVTVANAGDSRCVLCRGGAAVDLSSDHKPDLPEELERIEAVGWLKLKFHPKTCFAEPPWTRIARNRPVP